MAREVFSYPIQRSGRWDAGWQIYPADFNNDGRSDLLLYRPDGGGDQGLQHRPGRYSGFYDFFFYVEVNLGSGWTVLATQ